jgi:hypothetical protein
VIGVEVRDREVRDGLPLHAQVGHPRRYAAPAVHEQADGPCFHEMAALNPPA